MDGAGKKMPQNGMREERLLTDLKGDFALCDLFSRGTKRVGRILDTRHLKERSTRSITHRQQKTRTRFFLRFWSDSN